MNMNSFDPTTMTWATQMAHPQLSEGLDPFQEMYLPDQQSMYSHGYAGTEDVHNLHITTHAPSLKRFPSTYEDPYSDVVSTFDMANAQEQLEPETPSIDRDNKLLSFTSPRFDFSLLDYTYRQTTMTVAAQLHGMFFLAESPWSAAGDAQPPPNELTCYRRNLFQITGEIIMPRSLRYILTDTGEQIPILSQELVIQAAESLEGNPVKIISVPWKTPAQGGTSAEDKLEKEPSALALDMSTTQEPESDYATFPFSWKRLQFRIATANNGRRKELQQHFVVKLKVMATLPTGGKVSICEVQSGAIIVRGRSPRNFQSRKDMPLNGSTSHARKGRTPSGDGVKRSHDGPTSAPLQPDISATAPLQQYAESEVPMNLPNDWARPQALDKPRPNQLDAGFSYAVSSPEMTQFKKSPALPSAPINLKLVEDDTPKASSSSQTPPDHRSVKRIHIPARAPSFTLNTISSPDESADLLYEYFPLSLSDWSEPVDAVYRPHVVHHIRTKLPSEADPTRNVRSKRMYVE
ncbi:hypothetical protein AMS68_000087 [Peltaster fructicola]|uniref:NDT80 domain-containing protein n=1 Tax=Peltaster fructicola TaxID=286661 RepID=A0A6H0XJ65_9PEZI|nr:hypothetical protein AMS68_000087 [Peltaster fructicola]